MECLVLARKIKHTLLSFLPFPQHSFSIIPLSQNYRVLVFSFLFRLLEKLGAQASQEKCLLICGQWCGAGLVHALQTCSVRRTALRQGAGAKRGPPACPSQPFLFFLLLIQWEVQQ